MPEYTVSVHSHQGEPVRGASVYLYDRGTRFPIKAATTTSADGTATISIEARGPLDVSIVYGGVELSMGIGE